MLNAQGYLFLVALLALAWLAGYVMTRLGYPSLLGELGVGIIFGPPLLGWFSDAANGQPGAAMYLLGQLGTIVLMLLVCGFAAFGAVWAGIAALRLEFGK